jgi:hypothetical protein
MTPTINGRFDALNLRLGSVENSFEELLKNISNTIETANQYEKSHEQVFKEIGEHCRKALINYNERRK